MRLGAALARTLPLQRWEGLKKWVAGRRGGDSTGAARVGRVVVIIAVAVVVDGKACTIVGNLKD